jgi:hypothetical protein
MADLIPQLNALSIDNSADILYYEYSFSPEVTKLILDLILKMTKTTDTYDSVKNTVTYDGNTITLNEEFHITVLYTGGKPHEKAATLTEHLGKTVPITINKIGITNKFICAGVTIGGDIPYYGNDHQHITIGLNKEVKKGEKKVFPKDSYTALLADNAITLDEPLTVEATFGAHMKL